MAVEIDTADDHQDLFDRLRTFVKAAGPTGPDYNELDYESGDRQAFFEATGLAGGESIHMGLGVVEDVGTDSYALTAWQSRAYSGALPLTSQPGNSIIGHMPVWDSSIPYWFVANGRRLIVVTKVSSVYTALYLGKYLPYGTTGEFAQPYYVGAPFAANTRWSSVNEGFRNFWDPGDFGSYMLNPNGSWYKVSNFFDQSGEASAVNSNYVWPYHAGISGSDSVKNRWRQMRQLLDGDAGKFPCIVMGTNPANDIYGELDGVVAVQGFGAGSEDIIDIDGDDYLLVQNTFRTASHNYAAIRLT